jgi:hypothetical protein
MTTPLPFVYVASIRRTGSTMVAELLSDLPAGYVFREPRLGGGRLRLKPGIGELFAEHGIDVEAVSREMKQLERVEAITRFARFREETADRIGQLGVKEIRHEGWDDVSRAFPDMRVVVTVRDPRDIYLSMYHKRDRLAERGREWTDPEVLARDVNAEFAAIRQLIDRHEHLVIKYEQLCSNPESLDEVRIFAGSNVAGTGLLGRTSPGNRERHGEAIGDSRVGLWEREDDPEARRHMERAHELMAEYGAYWEYV